MHWWLPEAGVGEEGDSPQGLQTEAAPGTPSRQHCDVICFSRPYTTKFVAIPYDSRRKRSAF